MKSETIEKARKVKEGMAQKKWKTIEKACAALKLAPASYYTYAKKLQDDEGIQLPTTPTTASSWADEIKTLKRENEALKAKLKEDHQVIQKLQSKVLEFVLQN
jgi:hypothetical protein